MAAPDRGLVNGLPFGRADAALLVAGSVVLGALAMVSMRLVHAAADSTRPIVPTSVAALASHRLEPC